MDLEHKGTRGGTIRSRHFGTLEGINPKLKNKFYTKIKKKGFNRVKILEKLVTDFISKND